MSRDLPYMTPEETLEAVSRPGYDVTTESRFDVDPEAKHHAGCPCNDCRCPKCGRRDSKTDCETCRILAAPPFERGPYPRHFDNAPDYNPPKPEVWPTIRSNGQRIGDPVHVKLTCAKCGHGNRANLRETATGFECVNVGACEAQVRANAKLRLLKGGKP